MRSGQHVYQAQEAVFERKIPIWSSKEGSDADNKNAGKECHYRYTRWHYYRYTRWQKLPLQEVSLLPLHEVALLPLHEVALLPLQEVSLLPLHEVALLSIATRGGTTQSQSLHEVALPLHEGGLPKHDKIRPSYLACPESVESPALQHPLTEALKDPTGSRLFPTILDASLLLTQADFPRIIEALSTYLSMQPQHPPMRTTYQITNLSITWVSKTFIHNCTVG